MSTILNPPRDSRPTQVASDGVPAGRGRTHTPLHHAPIYRWPRLLARLLTLETLRNEPALRRFLMLLGIWIIAGSIIPAVSLVPEGATFLNTLGGASIAFVTPTALGVFVGFLLSFSEGDTDYAGKLVNAAFLAILGAWVASFDRLHAFLTVAIPQCAEQLALRPSVMIMQFFVFFIPALIVAYETSRHGFKYLLRVVAELHKIQELAQNNQEVARLFSDEATIGQQELLDKCHVSIPPMAQAMAHFSARKYEAALAVLEDYRPEVGEEDRYRFALGATKEKLGRNDEAIEDFQAIENPQPFQPGLSKLMGECYLEVNDPASAVVYFRSYLQAVRGWDAEVPELLLKAYQRLHAESEEKSPGNSHYQSAVELARRAMEENLLSRQQINRIWPGLLSGEAE